MNTWGYQLGFSHLQLGLSPRSNVSIQCFLHVFPDSHLEFGPAMVWPHEGSNGNFRIHMQNGSHAEGLARSWFMHIFKPFCTFQPRVALHGACRNAKTQGGGLMKLAPAIGLYFLQAMVSCIVGCAFFGNNSRLSLMHRFCASGMASKHMWGALQFISGRFGLNFGIQNFHL